jgi:SAM-dependent methyltransferase
MGKASWFETWFDSPYYHQLYFQHDKKEASDFIDLLINHIQPAPNSKMLDVACGLGRHSKLLANKGFDVTGIDLSPNSINAALQFEADNLHFFQHDMRLPFYINYFDVVFNFFTSFGYFRTLRENENAIRTMVQAMKPSGTVVIDYLNVHYAEDHFKHTFDKQVEDVNFHITKWMDEDFFYKKIEVEDEKLPEPQVFTEKVAKFSLGDFTDMLAYQDMQIKEVFGDYKLGKYHVKNSPRMVIIAKKR